jgi:uncharacterized protein DUF4230
LAGGRTVDVSADKERDMARDMDSGERFEPGQATVPDAGAATSRMARPGEPHPTAEFPPVARGVSGGGRDGGAGHDGDTGTGWPDGEAYDEDGAVAVKTRTRRDVAEPPPRTGGGLLRGLFWLVATIGVIVALVLGVQSIGLWPHLRNPFQSKTTDRSQPVLLKSIQDLSRFVAAEGNFQVVIDLQNDKKYVPDFLLNQRTLFVAAGSVEAYVDFSTIGQGAITESPDRKSVEIKLPAPQLAKTNIDHDKSYVFAEQRGLLNRVGDLLSGDPNRQQQLYQLGEQKISDAAKDSGLLDRAQENTRKMLTGMLTSLGYTSITITFAAP